MKNTSQLSIGPGRDSSDDATKVGLAALGAWVHLLVSTFAFQYLPDTLPRASLALYRVVSIPLFICGLLALAFLVRKAFRFQVAMSSRVAFALFVSMVSVIDGPLLVSAINIWFAPQTLESVVLVGHLEYTPPRGKYSANYQLLANDERGPAAFGYHIPRIRITAREYGTMSLFQNYSPRARREPPASPAVEVTVRQGYLGAPFVVSYKILPRGVRE